MDFHCPISPNEDHAMRFPSMREASDVERSVSASLREPGEWVMMTLSTVDGSCTLAVVRADGRQDWITGYDEV